VEVNGAHPTGSDVRLGVFVGHVFKIAVAAGNSMREVVLPKGKPPGETHSYSLEEIMQTLNVLPEPAATIVAAATSRAHRNRG
jgi:hypothetical protein